MNKVMQAMCDETISKIKNNDKLRYYLDDTLKIPDVYVGKDDIKLIILGQDPTIKNEKRRANITTVLNLNKPGALKNYLSNICTSLGIDIDNIYATNLLKNFFTKQPTQIEDKSIIKEYSKYWIPILRKEINKYPNVPIITLGEPLLSCFELINQPSEVRYYWSYKKGWNNKGLGKNFDYIKSENNEFNRIVIPFPHQPSINKEFYKHQFDSYCNYILKSKLFK